MHTPMQKWPTRNSLLNQLKNMWHIYLVQKDGSLSNSKGDFAIKLTYLVEAAGITGYMAAVKRRIDNSERYIIATLSHQFEL